MTQSSDRLILIAVPEEWDPDIDAVAEALRLRLNVPVQLVVGEYPSTDFEVDMDSLAEEIRSIPALVPGKAEGSGA